MIYFAIVFSKRKTYHVVLVGLLIGNENSWLLNVSSEFSVKQASIQQFCSPLKELPQTSKTLPSNPPKPKGLLKYFSPEKKKVDTDTKLNDESEERHRLEVLKECDNDMDMFLNEDDDLFDEITEPQQKKQRTWLLLSQVRIKGVPCLP